MAWLLVRHSLWVTIVLVSMQGLQGCLKKERLALLELKASLMISQDGDPDNLPSWVNDTEADCCHWERVQCNATTGHVIVLSLEDVTSSKVAERFLNFSLLDPFEELQQLGFKGNYFDGVVEIEGSQSLPRLRLLETLDLSFNNFDGRSIRSLSAFPSLKNLVLNYNNRLNGSLTMQDLSILKSLETLDLSSSSLSDYLVFRGLCGLKKLVELNLSQNRINNLPDCLGNLTNLRVLDISSSNLKGSIPSFITNLRSLEYLSLFDNNFEGLFSFSSLANHSKLEVFLLSSTTDNLHVETENPAWFPTFQSKVIQLRNCNLNLQTNRTIPSFLLYQHGLRLVDLSHNKLMGMLPSWILQNNSKLETLYLMNNSFTGFVQLPTFRHGLLDLQISDNKIGGQLPDNFGEIFSSLIYANLSRNSFEGILPSSIGDMQRLRMLDFSSNKFSGDLPRHLFSNCTSLTLLRLSHNNFHGQILPKFATLDRLRWLYLNNNSFTWNMEDGVSNRSYLKTLDISNNFVSGRIPRWIGSFKVLSVLLMSKNLLQDEIPVELCNLSSLRHLDLSDNRLSGFMPPCFNNITSFKFLYLQKNSLTGYIPYLSSGRYLASVDLRDNNFSGEIPHWMNNLRELRVLLLGGNELHGPIPTQLCQLDRVKLMDLSHNRLNGSIPSCFNNISFQMVEHKTTAVGSTAFEEDSGDTFRYYQNTVWSIFTVDVVWFIPGNTFYTYYNATLNLNPLLGERYMVSYELVEVEFRTKSNYYSYKGTILDYITGLDLSSNNLTGIIPPQIGELNQIAALNLSYNRLSGSIPDSFSNLTEIESLDLSYNNLNGGIPSQLTELYSLAIFNVSYNNLSGTTPTTGQFANFDENNYRGNSGLCGTLLKKSCTNAMSPPPPPALADGEEGEDSEIDLESFYWSFAASYVTILIGITIILCINPNWRRAWFFLVEWCIYHCLPQYFKNAFH
ncbi:putative Leucine-rich receptor-like kinase family protein [Quillaja saponaria]|uniref:Leucine-rich receptor-like kinase family protein n=1 Tax=Quillaja saponaria TaxID=32244 RepID=A0AAD7L799_QUISA|nr:putative Leucine-rich receptor-like kinase family protein [Quillaja saponaria]